VRAVGGIFLVTLLLLLTKESLAFQGETDEEIWLCLNDNDNLLCFEVVI
jgi:hypothetical protein